MFFLLMIMITIIIAIVFLIIGVMGEKEVKDFERNKVYGKGKVVGYTRAQGSSWYEPLVKIIGINDGKLYNCQIGSGNGTKYPKDSIIDVEYAKVKNLGINVIEVHSIEDPPSNGSKLFSIFKKLSIILFALSAVLVVIWITTLI